MTEVPAMVMALGGEAEPGFAMWASFVIIAATIIAYAWDKLPAEAVSLGSIAALLVLFAVVPDSGGLSPEELVAGFANPALVTVLALLIMGQGLFNNDALDAVARSMSRAGGTSRSRILAIVLVSVAAFSALINNTPAVVMFIPIMTTLARQKHFDP